MTCYKRQTQKYDILTIMEYWCFAFQHTQLAGSRDDDPRPRSSRY